MSVRVLVGHEHDCDRLEYAVMFCDTSMLAFGPVFNSGEECCNFLLWLKETSGTDPRLVERNCEGAVATFRSAVDDGWKPKEDDDEWDDLD